MKTLFPLMISISSVVLATQAQLAPVAPSHTGRVAGDYSILSRSAHERTWGKVVTVPLPSGETLLTTNSTYIEMATGLCFQDAQTQEWKDSQALIVPAPGGAISDQGQHKLFLPKNLGDGPIEVEMPSGQRLAAFPRFLAYADKDGKSVLIGTITNGEGKIISPTEVLYEDVCPEDIKGVAIRVCNHLWGYEADVLFTEQFPPAPEACGLSSQPGECGLQVWTEFVTAEP
ncbi:MAG: hypothetical protein NT154_22140, partial [Verrucomicrobia bacterium]|nr:hypothetical protein [Verrucomicrobiota bacterium]